MVGSSEVFILPVGPVIWNTRSEVRGHGSESTFITTTVFHWLTLGTAQYSKIHIRLGRYHFFYRWTLGATQYNLNESSFVYYLHLNYLNVL